MRTIHKYTVLPNEFAPQLGWDDLYPLGRINLFNVIQR